MGKYTNASNSDDRPFPCPAITSGQETYALISLIVVALSMLTVRVGMIALEMTGMSRDMAKFRALSAFSGAGFTTEEAEEVLAYPAGR